jgi:acyl-coenzyme A thioesterase PaaI-like protein
MSRGEMSFISVNHGSFYGANVADNAMATVTRRKQRLFLGEAVVTNGNGQVIATAAGTFMVRDSDAKPR